MRTKILLIGMVTLYTFAVSVGSSYAKIDRNTIAGMWLFEESKGDVAKDSSGKGNDGKLIGNPSWVAGKFGKALEVNGTNGVQVLHSDSLSLFTFTIAAWIKLDQGGIWQQIVIKPERNYSVGVSPANLVECAFTVGGNYRTALGKTTVTDGKWHHVAGTYDKSFMRVYIDGALEGEKSYTDAPDLSTQALIIAGPGEAVKKGIVDEVYIFNKALTKDEIGELIEGVASVKPTGKLATVWGSAKMTY